MNDYQYNEYFETISYTMTGWKLKIPRKSLSNCARFEEKSFRQTRKVVHGYQAIQWMIPISTNMC